MQCTNCLEEVQIALQHYDNEQGCWQCKRYTDQKQRLLTMHQMSTGQLERMMKNPLLSAERRAEISQVLEERKQRTEDT